MTDIGVPRSLDIGRVIQDSFQVLGRHLVTFLILALILVGIPRALFGVIQLTLLRNAVATMTFGGPVLYWSLLGILVAVVTGVILQATIISAAVSDMNGRPVSVVDSLRIGLRAFLPLIGLSILLGIAVWFGFMLLIVPGVLLALAWCVAVPAYVVEQPGVFGSFGRSADLTRGNRLNIFWLGCIFLIAAIIIGVVIGIVATVLRFATAGLFLYVQAVIVSPIISSAVAALGASLSAVLYTQLREIRDGVGAQSLAGIFD